jgi:hypothetical protein
MKYSFIFCIFIFFLIQVYFSLKSFSYEECSGFGENKTDETYPMSYQDAGWIYYLSSIGKNPVKIGKGLISSLSADRKFIVYTEEFMKPVPITRFDVDYTTLNVADIDGKGCREIFRNNRYIYDLTWSPVDNLIAFVYLGESRTLAVINPDGTGKKDLISRDDGIVDDIYSIHWASDGKSICFIDLYYFYRIDLSGKIINKISLDFIDSEENILSSDVEIVPCPVNDKIFLFTVMVKGTEEFIKEFHDCVTAIFIYDFSDKSYKRITTPDFTASDPVWSRDGKFIYFWGFGEKHYKEKYRHRIYRMKIDGSELTEICKGGYPGL